MKQFRSEVRRLITLPAELSWDMGAGYIRSIAVTVHDVSPSGIGLLVPMPFSIGAKLKITTDKQTRSAIVMRCSRQGAKYFLGFRFERVSS
jgi:hypothetical protein